MPWGCNPVSKGTHGLSCTQEGRQESSHIPLNDGISSPCHDCRLTDLAHFIH